MTNGMVSIEGSGQSRHFVVTLQILAVCRR